jgi:hypothetical protein
LLPRQNGKEHWVEIAFGREASATEFKVVLQDPDAAKLIRLEELLRNRFQMIGKSSVSLFEVSVDFYPKDKSDESRAQMVGVLQRYCLPKFDMFKSLLSHPRFIGDDPNHPERGKPTFLLPWHQSYGEGVGLKKGDEDVWLSPAKSYQPLVEKITYFGPKGGDVMIRIQNKMTNNRSREVAEDLQQSDKRVDCH